jgi:hypothetical protein
MTENGCGARRRLSLPRSLGRDQRLDLGSCRGKLGAISVAEGGDVRFNVVKRPLIVWHCDPFVARSVAPRRDLGLAP